MSKRREVKHRIGALDEINSIMLSMKNLAVIEMTKLSHYNETQKRVLESINHALNDVRYHYAPIYEYAIARPLYLLFGSERGFCGSYNEQLVQMIKLQSDRQHAILLGVGSRLAGPLLREYPSAVCLPSASVADEVETVLTNIMSEINHLRQQQGPIRLHIIHFNPDGHHPICQSVLPSTIQKPKFGLPPIINLPTPKLLSELLEHFLFAVTHYWLFNALMSENQSRIQHLDQAVHHLEQQIEELKKRRNMLRQEEIIEEIEVILLNSEMVGTPGSMKLEID